MKSKQRSEQKKTQSRLLKLDFINAISDLILSFAKIQPKTSKIIRNKFSITESFRNIIFRLLAEVQDLQASLEALETQKINAENVLKNLLDTRITLEKEIQLKKNSIFIDQQKVLPRRSRFPSVLKLQGYNA